MDSADRNGELDQDVQPVTSDQQANAAAPGTAEVQVSSVARMAMAWARDLSISVFIALVIILFLYQPVKVEGTSMMPALVDQERIFINKFAYWSGLDQIARGDTVVFEFPGDTSKSFIKRVIGMPGDTVEIQRGTVYVNGEELAEPYVPEQYRDRLSLEQQLVPEGEYFVLGDHRSSSNDSRSWGTVARKYIYGKAVFVYWPLNRLGALD